MGSEALGQSPGAVLGPEAGKGGHPAEEMRKCGWCDRKGTKNVTWKPREESPSGREGSL